jgi:hypothetical protein
MMSALQPRHDSIGAPCATRMSFVGATRTSCVGATRTSFVGATRMFFVGGSQKSGAAWLQLLHPRIACTGLRGRPATAAAATLWRAPP